MTDPAPASGLVSDLVRAFKAMGMYPEGHPARNRFFNPLLTGFNAYLHEHGPLIIQVRGDSVTVSGHPLAVRDGAGPFLAKECFRRQISSLNFSTGIQARDFELLFGILAMDAEILRQLGGALEFLRGKGSGAFQLEQVDYEGILERRTEGDAEAGSRYDAEVTSPMAPPDAESGLESVPELVGQKPPQEVTQEQWLKAKLAELNSAASAVQYKAVLQEIMTGLRSTGALNQPFYTLTVLRHLGRHMAGGTPAEVLGELREAVRELATPAALEEMAASLKERDLPDREAVEGVLREVSDLSIPVLFRSLIEEKEAFGRRAILSVLAGCGEILRSHLAGLFRDERWYVVRNALVLLQTVGSPRDSESVRTYLEHPNSKVRLEALRFLYRYPVRLQEDLMERLLNDEDPEVRARALYALGVLQGPEGLERQISMARKPLFGQGNVVRREMAIKGLGRTGGQQAVSFLRDLLTHRALVNRSAAAKLRMAAVTALTEMKDADALQVLKEALGRLRGESHRIAEDHLRRRPG
ncbi:MAG: HEAT repeat domain-containing protein [bacterium]|nr:MAG: HEAT repeat domain-containing protein [bacterium]